MLSKTKWQYWLRLNRNNYHNCLMRYCPPHYTSAMTFHYTYIIDWLHLCANLCLGNYTDDHLYCMMMLTRPGAPGMNPSFCRRKVSLLTVITRRISIIRKTRDICFCINILDAGRVIIPMLCLVCMTSQQHKSNYKTTGL